MPVSATKLTSCLSLGFPVLDTVFPGFELGDFAVLNGNISSFGVAKRVSSLTCAISAVVQVMPCTFLKARGDMPLCFLNARIR